MFALAAAFGLGAAIYWKKPENRVRWSFTQLHSSILRKRLSQAEQFLTERVAFSGRTLSRADFLAEYVMSTDSEKIVVKPCPAAPSHFVIPHRGRSFCFVLDGALWKLHSLDALPCPCDMIK